MRNNQIQVQEPLKSEYPAYTSKKANNLPFYEDLHFMWRHLPETMKASAKATTNDIGLLLKKAISIKTNFNKFRTI
jgi:hypothetical protein